MKKFIRLTVCFIFSLFLCETIHAQENQGNEESGPKIEILSTSNTSADKERPRTPFTLPTEIDCTYSSDYICIAIPNEIEYLSVIIEATDGSILWTGIITHEDSDATLPNLSDCAVITATTELGLEYSGTLDFEE